MATTDPLPGPPEPQGDFWVVGGGVDRCSAGLRLWGEGLDPDELTAALGAVPTLSCRKGDVTRRKTTTKVEPVGKWHLSLDQRAGTTLEAVINDLLDRVTADLAVWADLTSRFQADLFCGLHLEEWNRGLSFSPGTLKRVADRGLELGLDIYYVASDKPG